MASIQQAPEIQFAQRLASNEKPIRTRAIKKLRKYIRVRSQRQEGGFSNEELLKLWKGLFYCLWMQDKPLLQEELSNQIAGLLHNFVNVDMQFLYLETFLQTMKREWTGIDRLRMDKFYQLVRFLFRQTFEMLKRSGWETSLVSRFLQLLSDQILSKPAAAPSGLQIHILDLYLTELAGVGTAELNAEQNLAFIEPFCKTAAKTKDRVLLSTICSNVFRAIIDQAPFAVEDLLKEMKAAGGEDSDSGQASEEEEDSGQASEEEEGVQKSTSKPAGKKALKKSSTKQMNGTTSAEELDDEDEEDDELLHLEDGSDTEMADEEIGPVLQFDYGALADRLFKLASFSSSPNYNRQKLYKIIKTLRDLSEGIFPQDEYPEEVSTDEDDDEMFGSRKRMKRGRGFGEEEEDGGPSKKKAKGKKEASKPGKSDASEPVDVSDATNTKKKKKKKRKAKTGGEKSGDVEEQTEQKEGAEVKVTAVTGQEEGSEAKAMDTAPVTALQSAESDKKDIELVEPSLLKVETETSAPSEATVAVTSMETEGTSEPSEPDTVVVGSLSVVTIADSDDEPTAPVTEGNQEDQSETRTIEVEPVNQLEVQLLETASSKKKKKGKKGKLTSEQPSVEVAEDQPAPGTHEEEPAEGAAETESTTEITMTTTPETAPTSTPATKKKRRKSNKLQETVEMEAKASEESEPRVEAAEVQPAAPDTHNEEAADGAAETERIPEIATTTTPEIATTTTPEIATTTTPGAKKKRRKSNKLQEPEETEMEAKASEECEPSVEVVEDQPAAPETHIDAPAEEKAETESIPETTTTSTPGAKKRRRKSNKLQEPEQMVEMEAKASEESEPSVEAAEVQPAAPDTHNEEAADGAAETEPTPEIATTTTPEIAPTTSPEIATTTTPGAKKKRRKSNKLQEPEETAEVEAKSSEAELDQVSSLPAEAETATEDAKATPRKTKKKAKLRDTTQEEGVETETTPAETPEGATAADEVPADAAPLKKKKNKKSKAAMDQVVEEDVEPQLDAETTGTEEQATPIKKKKRKASAEKEAKIQSEVEESGGHDELPAALKKKKRKYPVVVEVEADELEAAAEAARLNGLAGSGGKKSKMSNLSEPSSSMSTKKASKLKVKKNKGNDFITFQGSAAVPTALFCRTPPSGSKKCQTPKSDSKKVTFGLMNNKTTEFRKNDRSLLVSPEGSSRVPFNPEQKPVCGVLKFSSPASTKKIPKIRKTPGRPTAADFF